VTDQDPIRDDIFWLRLIIGHAFINGAGNVVLQAATDVLRSREESLGQFEQAESPA
jgi:hypothetical protein